jgi:hypothetical protein
MHGVNIKELVISWESAVRLVAALTQEIKTRYPLGR